MKEEKLTSILNGITLLCNELGMAVPDLYSGIDLVRNGIKTAPEINIYVDDSFDDAGKEKIRAFLKVPELAGKHAVKLSSLVFNTEVRINFCDLFTSLSKKVGQMEPACCVIFIKTSMPDESLRGLEYLEELVSQNSICFLYSDLSLPAPVADLLKSKNSLLSFIDSNDIPEGGIEKIFGKSNAHAVVTAGRSLSACRSITSLIELLEIMLRKETAGMKAKRALNQQQASLYVKRAAPALSQIELSNEIKNKLQNHIYAFEKGFSQRMDDFLRPQTGKLFKEAMEIVDSLDELDENKSHKFLVLTLPREFENNFTGFLRQKFHQQMINDLVALKDHLVLTQTQLENIAEQNNFTLISINIRFLTDTSIEKTLNNAIRIDKPFKGERLSKGFIEYMMAARKYQIIMAMFLSTFGLSFIRNLKQYMIPVTIILVGLGLYNVGREVIKEREETKKKELEKARENLLAECRRIFMEVRKDWSDVISLYLREYFQVYTPLADQLIKESFARSNEKAIEDKRKIQKQLQSIDTTERKFLQIEKNRETLYKENQRLQTELRQSLLSLINTRPAAT